MDDLSVILPPPDIRVIADKTAEFVSRNGVEFEARIIAANTGNPKFRFMNAEDPYRAYFDAKVREFREKRLNAAQDGEKKPEENAVEPAAQPEPAQEAPAPVEQVQEVEEKKAQEPHVVQKAAVENPLAKAMRGVNKEEPPASQEFAVPHPDYLPPVDIDIIKLTAQYTAANGVQFLYGLTNREFKNPQFDFLKPSHALFTYFMALVDQYSKAMAAADALRARMSELSVNKYSLLEKSVHRMEYTRIQEERKRLEQAEEDAERVAFLQIDWHDFVVVETIEFKEDDVLTTPAQLQNQQAYERFVGGAAAPATAEEGDEEMEVDEPTPAKPQPTVADADVDDGELRIRKDYVPQVKAGTKAITHFIDPRTGQEVRIDESAEHMRINLLDPKWKEQRQRMLEKHKGTSFTSGDDIASALAGLAKNRPDIFGGDEFTAKPGADAEGPPGSVPPAPVPSIPVSTIPPVVAPPAALPPQRSMLPPVPSFPPPVPQPAPVAAIPPPVMPPRPTIGQMMGIGSLLPPAQPPAIPLPSFPGPPPMPVIPLPGPSAVPLPLPAGIPPPPSVGASLKRPRDEKTLVSEAEWSSKFPSFIRFGVQCPSDSSAPENNLKGQIVPVELRVTEPISAIKDALMGPLGGLSGSKYQFKHWCGFLKDSNTIAHYNIAPGEVIELQLRTRGGRR